MPLQATSGAASYDAFGGGVAAVPNYIEDVFSTWLYTGNGSTQTINNGIDLAGKGGLVWTKKRSGAEEHGLVDTVRGNESVLATNFTDGAWDSDSGGITSFGSTGYSIGNYAFINQSSATYASWTFREQPKFFDVVTYTGNGSSQNIAHNLGSVPGCIIVKSTSTVNDWRVYHRSLATVDSALRLNSTAAVGSSSTFWNSTAPTSTQFTVGSDGSVNANGATYVAYLFAHDAGGFGLTGTDNVISCGSFTTNGSGQATVDLGYEPQWLMYKGSSAVTNWSIADNMRGFVVGAANAGSKYLNANSSSAELDTPPVGITNTGFNYDGAPSTTFIYIAIRRGPMRTPTTGTSVFAPALASSSGTYTATSNFPVDWAIEGDRASTTKFFAGTRLIGDATLQPNTTDAESAQSWGFANMTGFTLPGVVGDYSGFINWMFRRAPGFFDVVCYTGTGSARTVAHNLGVAPELIITKCRGDAFGWAVYSNAVGNTAALFLETTAVPDTNSAYWNNTTPTSTVFTVGSANRTNRTSLGMVAYLFASCPGVSKVGSYTGNGSSQTINMGFTGGARFFLVKRTDSTGDWWVYDSARGIVSAADPALRLNSTAAEVTSADAVDTDSTGLIVNQESTCNINVSSATYIYLGIA